MDQVEVAGLRIAYERAGTGPPLVLLHGFIGDSSGTWRHQIDGLSDEYTVVAWDAPGAGQSSDPPDSFRMPAYADCLAAFIAALDLGRPHVAGLSFGGILALELFRRHPALPSTLVLAGGYAGWVGSLGPEVAEQRLQQNLESAHLPPDAFVAALLPSMFSEPLPADSIRDFVASVRHFRLAGFQAMARSCAEADLRDVLSGIDVPTLLLYGDRDVRASMTVAEQLRDAIRTSRLVVMPGVGHVSSVEAPERFNAELRAFLRQQDA